MDNAQVWAALGIVAASSGSLVAATLLVTASKIDGLRNGMAAEFGRTRERIDLLDRDVQKIAEKVFGS